MRNWTGAPGPEPLEIRAAIRRPVQRYRMVHLRRAHLSGRMIVFPTHQWWPTIHGTPIMCSVGINDGPTNAATWTTYDKRR